MLCLWLARPAALNSRVDVLRNESAVLVNRDSRSIGEIARVETDHQSMSGLVEYFEFYRLDLEGVNVKEQ